MQGAPGSQSCTPKQLEMRIACRPPAGTQADGLDAFPELWQSSDSLERVEPQVLEVDVF